MIVGISGKMGCGKSTVAKMVAERVPGARVMSFADPLREEVAALLGCSLELVVRNPSFKGMHWRVGYRVMTGREVLQWWGTEVRRAADPDYWVKQARKRALAHPGLVVFDDMRFKGEADFVSGEGGLVFRIQPHELWRPGENAWHQSEVDLDDYQGRWDALFAPGFGPEALEAVAASIERDVMAAAGACP